jgi:hypothetical protein
MALIKVSVGEVRLNKPVRFPIYSSSGKLLLNEGHRIESERQLERLFAAGAFREDDAGRPATSAMAAELLLVSSAEHRARAESQDRSGTGDFPRPPQVFEGFQITIDSAAHLDMAVAFVGILEGKGLLVNAPDCDALEPGATVHGRLLFGRDVCAFRTRVAARSTDLGGLVLLDFPQNVRRHPVRRHRRVQAAIPARIIRNDAESFEAKAVDISLEGVGLTCETLLLEAGEHFRLALRLTTEGKTHSLLLNCVARNIRARANGFVFGAEIRAAAAEARAVLRNFVFETATGTTL